MADLTARVDLVQGDVTLSLDAAECLGGYQIELTRSRPPARDYDGEGAEVLVYGLGSARRRLSIAGTTEPYAMPPDLSALDLGADVTALIHWADGSTTTTLVGGTSGIDPVSSNFMDGTTSWRLSVEGLITSGLDPVGSGA